MDYTSQYQFTNTQPYQSFVPIPPLTPSHSHSTASDDFNANGSANAGSNTNGSNRNTSPPEAFESLPQNDHFNGFDYAQGFNTNFPGPPTPPGQSAFGQQQRAQHNGAAANGADPFSSAELAKSEPGFDDLGQGRGGSDDEDLTPAQSRRKAQNRAAQRAFRERKERHVKDLEVKLADLEAAQQQSAVENERLKQDLQKMSTENEILRATSHMSNGHHNPPSEPATTGPMKYSPTDFYSNVLQGHENKSPSHRVVAGDDGERLLAAGATWDFIISHDLFKRGLVDIGDVSERLKHAARCDGQGPVFSELSILEAIQQGVASGTDDLL